MLHELQVRNLAILEEASVVLGAGLNVISGETGAGKSVLLTGIDLLLGGRADSGLVRTGSARAEVLGRFSWHAGLNPIFEELGWEPVPDGEDLLVRRVVTAAGRSRAFVADRPCTAALLRRIGTALVDRVGQHDQQELMLEDSHRDVLDRLAGAEPERALVAEAHGALARTLSERERLRRSVQDRADRLDYLDFVLGELEVFGPGADEVPELRAELQRLRHSEELRAHGRRAHHALYDGDGSATEQLDRALVALEALGAIDGSLQPLLAELQGAQDVVEELGRNLRSYASRLEHDPGRQVEVEDRLAEYERLARKHRCTSEQLFERFESLREESSKLVGSEETARVLDDRITEERQAAAAAGDRLREKRRSAIPGIVSAVVEQLSSLGMSGARFEIALEPLPDGVGLDVGRGRVAAHGPDRVRFDLSANPGEELRPLARIASGGELSRILLALKRALWTRREAGTLIFDEIDAGLGGEAGDLVGAKLVDFASQAQLLCVTHLPQIAARADVHLLVAKSTSGSRTSSVVRPLAANERVGEIARMLAGQTDSQRALAYSTELVERLGLQPQTPPARPCGRTDQ